MNSFIPPARLNSVKKALQTTFDTADLSNLTPLSGGLSTSLVYKITIHDQSYLLKLETPTEENSQTPSCISIAANADIAPPLYYHNPADGISITAFIETHPLRTTFASHDQLLIQLAKTIRSIHEMPPFPKEGSLLDTINALIAQIKTFPGFTETLFEDFFEYYTLIQKHYPWQDTDKVPSHNDLNPNNIISDGKRIWIIDWDAAFQNDRYVDLAISANFFITTDTQEQLFLQTYFATPTNYHSSRLFLMRQTCRLIYAILMFRLAHTSNPTCLEETPHNDLQSATPKTIGQKLSSGELSLSSWKGQLLYGKAMLNEALANLRSPRFKLAIAQLIPPAPQPTD